jgi:predicted transcriptional regulator
MQDTCVCQVVKKLNLKNNLISHHIKVLQEMGFVENRKNGQHVIYHLTDSKKDMVKELLLLLGK